MGDGRKRLRAHWPPRRTQIVQVQFDERQYADLYLMAQAKGWSLGEEISARCFRPDAMVDEVRDAFMLAIEFALSIDDGGGAKDALAFLRGWTEGDTSEWPEFQGHQEADRPSGPLAGSAPGKAGAARDKQS